MSGGFKGRQSNLRVSGQIHPNLPPSGCLEKAKLTAHWLTCATLPGCESGVSLVMPVCGGKG
jgi:hypothetical protein